MVKSSSIRDVDRHIVGVDARAQTNKIHVSVPSGSALHSNRIPKDCDVKDAYNLGKQLVDFMMEEESVS
jgi:hypothetical protein